MGIGLVRERIVTARNGLPVLKGATRLLGSLLISLCAATSLHGQEVLRTHWDLWTTPSRAAPLSTLDDLDGDGFLDLILGDSSLMPGEVRLVSGATGALLRTLTFGNRRLGEFVVALDDVTGDGVNDWTSSAAGGRAVVWSGATFAKVWDGPPFDSAASIGDIDGDGIGDYLNAFFGAVGSSGSAQVYYGGRFTLAYSMSAPGAVHYGLASAALGDLDGDGIGDFAIGAPGGGSDEICVPGAVYVHSGSDGHLLYLLEGEGVNSFFGGELAAPGDLNGDGIGDLVVGARDCCQTYCDQTREGRISFFDGPTGDVLGHVSAESLHGRDLGLRLVSVGDLDGNGYGDILTNFHVAHGPIGRRAAILIALDGATRQPIYRFMSPLVDACPAFGMQIAAADDANGDDFPDFWVSSASCSTFSGLPDDHVDLFSGAPKGIRALGARCGGLPSSPPLRIGAGGVPEIGQSLPIHLSGVAPEARVRLLLGALEPRLLRSVPGPACVPRVRPVEVRPAIAKRVRPGEGVATAFISIPNIPDLIGTKFHAQWTLDAPHSGTSRVLEIEVQPSNPLRGW